MANPESFENLLHSVIETLPRSWGPRREQPEHERMFSGTAEIQQSMQTGGDKMTTWMREALAFSEVLKGGFEGGGEENVDLVTFGSIARAHVSKGSNQGLAE